MCGSCLGEEEGGGEGEGDGGGEGEGEGENGGGESGGGGTEGLGGRGGGGGDFVSADVASRSSLVASVWSSHDEKGGGENIGVGVASSSSLSSRKRGGENVGVGVSSFLSTGGGRGGGENSSVGVLLSSSLGPSRWGLCKAEGGGGGGLIACSSSSSRWGLCDEGAVCLLASLLLEAASGALLSKVAGCFRHCTVSSTFFRLLLGLGGTGGGDLTGDSLAILSLRCSPADF